MEIKRKIRSEKVMNIGFAKIPIGANSGNEVGGNQPCTG